MNALIKSLFFDTSRDAWSHNNLQPKEPVFRVNWPLYDEVVKSRRCIGYTEMQHRQFVQMVNQVSQNLVHTVTPD